MPKLTHKQAIKAHGALMQLAELENIPAIPTGMAIRRGVRLLAPIAEDVEEERKKLLDKYLERDEKGSRVAKETNPDGTVKSWKLTDEEAAQQEYDALYEAEVDIAWTIPESFFAGSSPKPILLIALGDLLTEDKKGS